MTQPDIDYMIVMERRRDELAEAAHFRLVKEAVAGNRLNGQPFFQPRISHLRNTVMLSLANFLSMVAGRMLSWSCRLQTRVEFMKEGVAEKRASPC